ncbi:MAG: IS21 family transposase [Candidatus Marinimicrobia bacterium]|nr:IS21 family transposase [Candidatus Neomarinimicrobiota bacterium]
MKHIRKIIELHERSGLSVRQIKNALNLPRSTVSDYLKAWGDSDLSLKQMESLNDDQVYTALFGSKVQKSRRPLPDFSKMHTELKKKHVTRSLLWEEYREQHPKGLGYSQFCEHYRLWSKKVNVSMRQVHKAGEKLFVDYSGLTMEVIDPKTGEISKAEVFVAALGASGYSYAEASMSQQKQDFITSHIRAFQFYGGVTEVLVPDNLRSAVTRANWYDPDINESYQDMADHYGTVVVPARPYKPKDKSKAELSVKLVQRWILARLRHRQFFSLHELNEAIWELLEDLNHRKMRHLNKSRRELFEELDQPALKALPERAYIYKDFKDCKVNIDYHIQLESDYYSVPYQLAGKVVRARYTSTTVEIYHENKRVATHPRGPGKGIAATITDHMASAHKAMAEWTPSKVISWGKGYGPTTGDLFEKIMADKPHPEMGFRTCLGILSRAKGEDNSRVEAVSKRMLELKLYRVKNFKNILSNKTYSQTLDEPLEMTPPDSHHENVRGQQCYQ